MAPVGKEPPVNLPSSEGAVWAVPEETVWLMPLLLTQQTFCPAVIVAVLGLNVNEPVAVMVALAPELAQLAGGVPPPPPPPYGDVEPPHAANSTTPAAPSVRVITLDRMDPPRWCVGRSAALSRMPTTLRNARDLSENDEALGRPLVALALQRVGREAG